MSTCAEHLRELVKNHRSETDLLAALVLDAADRIERLETEGVPGQMHAVDHVFYKLTVAQRDSAWQEIEQLKQVIHKLDPKHPVLSN